MSALVLAQGPEGVFGPETRLAQAPNNTTADKMDETGVGDDISGEATHANATGERVATKPDNAAFERQRGFRRIALDNDSSNTSVELPNGKQLDVRSRGDNKLYLKKDIVEARTTLNLFANESNGSVRARLGNGRYSDIKVMPDKASENALERLRMNFCTNETCKIELKEVGQGNESRAAYDVQVDKKVKVLGLFNARYESNAQVDAQTGDVIKSKRPWWSFMANISKD
ncbi:MAG: hypothetical protein ACOCUT_00445 [bacterium]